MAILSEKKLVMLRPSEITLSPHQPRRSFDEYELKLLADSISASGIIQPLAVRKKVDGSYELIAGERRLKAAIAAGLRRVPCVIHKADDETAALYALIENLQRSNLTIFEEASGLQHLIHEYGMSQSEMASRLGFAQSTLSNKLRLLKLDSAIQQRITSARLTERHARALLRLPDDARETALDHIVAEGLTLKQSEEYINGLLAPKAPEEEPAPPPEPIRKAMIGDVRLFSNSLSKLLSTLQSAGIEAKSQRREDDRYIEFRVKIRKNAAEPESYSQLKIC